MANLRVTPTNDLIVNKVPGAADNPGRSRLSVDLLGMEVANELGVDPNNLSAYNLSAQKIDQYENQLHSGTQNGNNNR